MRLLLLLLLTVVVGAVGYSFAELIAPGDGPTGMVSAWIGEVLFLAGTITLWIGGPPPPPE